MQCPSCKRKIIDTASFCTFCGSTITNQASATQAGAQAVGAGALTNKKTLVIVLIIAIVVVLLAIGGLTWWKLSSDAAAKAQAEQAQADSLHSLHEVRFSVTAPDWTEGSTRIPVAIVGTDATGALVDQVQFMDGSGEGIKLAQGSYTVSFPASPLLEGGRIYSDNDTTVEMTLGNDLADGQTFSPDGVAVEFATADPITVTDEQIGRAAEYAQKDSLEGAADKVPALKDAATSVRDQAIADKQAADAAAAAASEEAARQQAVLEDSGAIYSNQYFTVRAQDYMHITKVTEKTDANGNPVYWVSLTLNETRADGSEYPGAGEDYEYTVDLAGSIIPTRESYSFPRLATNEPYTPSISINGDYVVYITNAAG